MTATTELASNAGRLVRLRMTAVIQPAAANRIVTPDGVNLVLPGQGGVVAGIALGDRAGGWLGDHVEPGLSLGHPEAEAMHAIRRFACVGNRVTVIDGPAAGSEGIVYGKHGAVLAMLPADALRRAAPGERVSIEAEGAGLALTDHADIRFHSLSPALQRRWLRRVDGTGRVVVPVVATLPARAAAAGIGMPAAMFNMDLHVYDPPLADLTRDLRFGDIVAVLDQDHRYGRRHAPGWTSVGVISHGEARAGGHGFGLMTLLTAPSDTISLLETAEARVDLLMGLPDAVR